MQELQSAQPFASLLIAVPDRNFDPDKGWAPDSLKATQALCSIRLVHSVAVILPAADEMFNCKEQGLLLIIRH